MQVEFPHYEYLSVQHGRIAQPENLANFELWMQEYTNSMRDIFTSIKPYLPRACANVLDIGGGLGGIDVHIAKHYGEQPHIAILDGVDAPPEMVRHDMPHSNAAVAEDFLRLNGVEQMSFIAPDDFEKWKSPMFDLVVSFAAYAFHINPEVYLKHLKSLCKPRTVLIFEVRKKPNDWQVLLHDTFGPAKLVYSADKYWRLAYRAT